MCPECQYRPSRDQRDQKQDGRCVPCHHTAASRPNALPRKAAKSKAPVEQPWAYV
jgi:hypothetical protein